MPQKVKFTHYSYRHGKTLLEALHSEELKEIHYILGSLPKFKHGQKKGKTVAKLIASAFKERGWSREVAISLSQTKKDFVDIYKNRIVIEQEYSRFENLFRDFFRFEILYANKIMDVGVIITFSEEALRAWEKEYRYYRSSKGFQEILNQGMTSMPLAVSAYPQARASVQRIKEFLEGKYNTFVRVPLYCIGIE